MNESKYLQKMSDDNILKHSQNVKTIRDLLFLLNLPANTQCYKHIKKRLKELNIVINSKSIGNGDKLRRKSITNEQIITLCAEKKSRRSILIELNLSESGTNVKWIDKKIKENNIDISHWTGAVHNSGKVMFKSAGFDPCYFLKENSAYSRTRLKINLLRRGLIEYKCNSCGIKEWNGKRISLHIEHINGVNNDNRLENICFLCPNCHSQTPTYCGRNVGKKNKNKKKCLHCENYTSNKSGSCFLCTAIDVSEKILSDRRDSNPHASQRIIY